MNNTINFSENINPINQPQIPYYFDTSPNLNTFPNQENSPKNDNIFSNQISYETNPTTICSNQIDKFKLQVIEKDKIIINLKQKEKDLNKQITKLNLLLNDKDDQIFRLEDKIQELLQALKTAEFQTEIKLNKFSEDEKNYNLKINDIIIEEETLKKKIENLTTVIEANEESMKNLYIEKQKKDEDIKNLIEELKKKDNLIDINYNKKQILQNENKQLPSLKGKIDDLEKIILELKDEIIVLRDINDKLIEEKNELNELLNKKEDEIQKNRIYEQSLINLNNKNISLNKEIQKKGNDIQSLDDKYLSLMNNNETFIHLITNELGNFLNYLESINMNNLLSLNNDTFKIPLNNLPNFEHTKLDQNFMLKYEILEEKITDMLNICKISVNKLNHELTTSEEKNNNLINEKNEIKKENFALKNKITDITQDNNDKNLNMQKKVNDLNEAQNQNQILKRENEDLNYKNSILDKEYQRLINDIDNKLIQFPLRPLDEIDETNFLINNQNFAKENFNNVKTLSTNKIIHKIDSLIYLNKEINKELSEMIRENKSINQKNVDLTNENLLLKDKISSYEESIQTEINNYKNRKENELNETKEVLFNKVKSLNQILEQGNKLIKSYELEVAELKNRNSKLEFNLKMLTQSHQELENIVNMNDNGLKEQIEIKEHDYQNLLKEIELKDLQIKSLQKLLEQYQVDKNGDIFNYDLENEEFKEEDSIVSFAKDKMKEKQLNKLINNFDDIIKQNDKDKDD